MNKREIAKELIRRNQKQLAREVLALTIEQKGKKEFLASFDPKIYKLIEDYIDKIFPSSSWGNEKGEEGVGGWTISVENLPMSVYKKLERLGVLNETLNNRIDNFFEEWKKYDVRLEGYIHKDKDEYNTFFDGINLMKSIKSYNDKEFEEAWWDLEADKHDNKRAWWD